MTRGRARSAAITAALAGFALVSVLGMGWFLLRPDAAAGTLIWLQHAAFEPWAAPAGVAAFALLALAGAPQVVLIPLLVAAFGPWLGFFYAWLGKLISSAAGFAVGRRFGARRVEAAASARVAALLRALSRNGFWASALIRLVPTVPAVAVNIAAGCTPIRFRDFLAGTALGSIPKMALIAFAGQAAISGLTGGGAKAWAMLGLAAALLAALALAGRLWLKRRAIPPGPG